MNLVADHRFFLHLQLIRTKIQEVLQQLRLELAVDTERPLTLDELVDTCLEASSSVSKNDPMRCVHPQTACWYFVWSLSSLC